MFLVFLIPFLIVIAVFFLVVLGIIITGMPAVPTPKDAIDKLIKNISPPSNALIYDLGAGDGRILLALEKAFDIPGVGFELSLCPYLKARFLFWRNKAKSRVYFQNFFQADISQADIIFCFLTKKVYPRLEAKLKKEAKPGSIFIVYGLPFLQRQPYKVVPCQLDSIYFYRI